MRKTTTQVLSLITLFFLLPLWLSAQMIWPGDINNNGIVVLPESTKKYILDNSAYVPKKH